MVSTAELQQVMREMAYSIVQAIGESHSSINENLRCLANNVQDKKKEQEISSRGKGLVDQGVR